MWVDDDNNDKIWNKKYKYVLLIVIIIVVGNNVPFLLLLPLLTLHLQKYICMHMEWQWQVKQSNLWGFWTFILRMVFEKQDIHC